MAKLNLFKIELRDDYSRGMNDADDNSFHSFSYGETSCGRSPYGTQMGTPVGFSFGAADLHKSITEEDETTVL